MSSKSAKSRHNTPAPAGKLQLALAAILLCLLAFIAYRPAAAGPLIWDDNDYVSANTNLRSPQGLANIWFHPASSPQYYPLVFTTFWIEHALWGPEPRGYREVNILLHALSAILLWRLLKRLEVPGAFLAAAVFAVHPVMVESVAWITERKNTLSMVFYLLAMSAILKFLGILGNSDEKTSPKSPRPSAQYALALLFFLLALFSKTVTSTLPAAALVIVWWKRGRITPRDFAALLPFFALGIAGGTVTGYLERQHVGASGAEWDLSLPQRILIAGRVVWFYFAKLIFPAGLSFIYPRWTIDPTAPLQWLYPLGLLCTILALWLLRKRLGRGAVAATLLFVGTLAPAMGFVNVFPMRYSFVADHFQYHAAAAMIALLSAVLTLGARRALAGRIPALKIRPALLGGGTALVLALLVATAFRAAVYADHKTLWEDARAKNPGSWMVHTQLGHLAMTRRPPDLQTARDHYFRSLELAPRSFEAHLDAGIVLAAMNQIEPARDHFLRVIELEPRDARPHHWLGAIALKQHQLDQAIDQFRKALAKQPGLDKARLDLATTLDRRGDANAAIEQLQIIIQSDPNALPAFERLADILYRAKRHQECEPILRRILRIDPNHPEAHFTLGVLLAKQNPQEASQHLERAFQLNPALRSRIPGLK